MLIFRIKVQGPGEVTAKDIQTDGMVEVLNPDHHIATLDADGKLEAELEIRIGRGYCPADLNKKEDQEIGVIPIDCLFSPVRRVSYAVENTRVGRRTDYDKLTLEVWTDGRITPDDALTMSAAILRAARPGTSVGGTNLEGFMRQKTFAGGTHATDIARKGIRGTGICQM